MLWEDCVLIVYPRHRQIDGGGERFVSNALLTGEYKSTLVAIFAARRDSRPTSIPKAILVRPEISSG
jgi:hypothetical protein